MVPPLLRGMFVNRSLKRTFGILNVDSEILMNVSVPIGECSSYLCARLSHKLHIKCYFISIEVLLYDLQ